MSRGTHTHGRVCYNGTHKNHTLRSTPPQKHTCTTHNSPQEKNRKESSEHFHNATFTGPAVNETVGRCAMTNPLARRRNEDILENRMDPRKVRVEPSSGVLRSVGSIAPDTDEELAKSSDRIEKNAVSRLIRTTSMRSGTTEEELFLYITPPVKGFELTPSFICRKRSGEVNPDPLSSYRFTWYRSRKYYLCNGEHCINAGAEEREMKCQCLTCQQYGNERHSYFCSPECMAKNWKYHVKWDWERCGSVGLTLSRRPQR